MDKDFILKYLAEHQNAISLPKHDGDAGFDIVSLKDPEIVGVKHHSSDNLWHRIDYIVYDTCLRIEPNPKNAFYTLGLPRSNIRNVNLSLANSVGVIDSGYRGNILICFKYHWQPEDLQLVGGLTPSLVGQVNFEKIYKKGEAIAQLTFTKHVIPSLLKIKDMTEFSETTRGDKGFGSTNKPTKL